MGFKILTLHVRVTDMHPTLFVCFECIRIVVKQSTTLTTSSLSSFGRIVKCDLSELCVDLVYTLDLLAMGTLKFELDVAQHTAHSTQHNTHAHTHNTQLTTHKLLCSVLCVVCCVVCVVCCVCVCVVGVSK